MTRLRDPFAVALGIACAGALVLTGLAAAAPGPLRPWAAVAAPSAPGPARPQVTGVAGPAMLTSAAGDASPADDPAVDGPRAPVVDPQWVSSRAAATGIPATALRAYGQATLRVAGEDPACHLGWTTLAAVGAVESGHGTHGGAVLGQDGRSTPPILGPALNGDGVAAVPATPASTAWHGDPRWDHAVGPMQMLPSTWARWAADGDGDGVADPNDLDDAALAAARYLCAGGGDLATDAGWRAAVLAYNHSTEYVAAVLVTAQVYDVAG